MNKEIDRRVDFSAVQDNFDLSIALSGNDNKLTGKNGSPLLL